MINALFPDDFFAALLQVPLINRYADYSNSASSRLAQQRSVNRRQYSVGDSRKTVDWRASARASQLLVRPLQDSNTRSLVLCLDRSSSLISESQDRDFAQRRLAFAIAWRCLRQQGRLVIVAGKQVCRISSITQIAALQDFLEKLSDVDHEDLDLSLLHAQDSADELVLLSDTWLNFERLNAARYYAKRLRHVLMITEREACLPKQKLKLRHAETGQALAVDWHNNPPQQRFQEFVERQHHQLRSLGFESNSFYCPAVTEAAQLIEQSREFLLH
ncbi:MAG: hypothetical protein ACI84O_000953 [Myxococcota bacterium]|jgi:uncharacterized protein (DUF58 family)